VKTEGFTPNAWGKVEVFEAALIQAYDPRVSTSSRRPTSKTDWKIGIAKWVVEHLLKAKQQS